MRADEVYWMLLSFVAMPSEIQESHFSKEIPSRDNPFVMYPTKNDLIGLNIALSEYYLPWRDNFSDSGSIFLEKFNLTRESLVSTGPFDVGPGILCREEFFGGDGWMQLRSLSAMAIEESGFGACSVPRPIYFNELVELVDPDESDGSYVSDVLMEGEVRRIATYDGGSLKNEMFLIENEIALTRMYLDDGGVDERYFIKRAEVSLPNYLAAMKFFPKMEKPFASASKKKHRM